MTRFQKWFDAYVALLPSDYHLLGDLLMRFPPSARISFVTTALLATLVACGNHGGGGGGDGGGAGPKPSDQHQGEDGIAGLKTAKRETTYDSENKITELIERNGDKTVTTDYDRITHKIVKIVEESDDKTVTTEYDEETGELESKEVRTMTFADNLGTRTSERYDGNGTLTGKDRRETVYEGDNKIESKYFDENDRLSRLTHYEYIGDKEVKEVTESYDDNGKVKSTTTQKWVYEVDGREKSYISETANTGETPVVEESRKTDWVAGTAINEKQNYAKSTITRTVRTFDPKDTSDSSVGGDGFWLTMEESEVTPAKDGKPEAIKVVTKLTQTCDSNGASRTCQTSGKEEDEEMTGSGTYKLVESPFVKSEQIWLPLTSVYTTNGQTASWTFEYNAMNLCTHYVYNSEGVVGESKTSYDTSGLNELEHVLTINGELSTRTVYEY